MQSPRPIFLTIAIAAGNLVAFAPIAMSDAPPVASEAGVTASAVTAGAAATFKKYQPTDVSLKQYEYPDWFRDAKFGIWSVWGPMAVPRQGDWYAKHMYTENHPAYKYHVKHYGHPSEFGYKDLIPLWKAEKWDPEALMKLYKRAGAKYFCSIATHHDNFFLWNSKLNRWNAVNMGPKKDVIGIWKAAAKKEGLYFGVTEHLGASYTWFQASRRADKKGPKAGVPYDGNNPEFSDLYHEKAAPGDTAWLTKNPVWQQEWFERIKELVDNYQPDLLYSDSGLPFNNVGRKLIAHYYESAQKTNPDGVVYNCKQLSEGRWVRDYERGSAMGIGAEPWQTDTSIGDWIYRTGDKYKTAPQIIQMLVDIVSKNGNLLLNILQTPEGELDAPQIVALEEIAVWIEANGEAIYGTRPWKIYGEGPSLLQLPKGPFDGIKDVRAYQQGDLRFTEKGNLLYVFCMETPTGDISIHSLGLKKETGRKIKSARMLGSTEEIKWTQNEDAVIIQKPARLPGYKTVVFAIEWQ
jgi:alpha-L-fucosidase